MENNKQNLPISEKNNLKEEDNTPEVNTIKNDKQKVDEESEKCCNKTGEQRPNAKLKMLKEETRSLSIKDVGLNPLHIQSAMRSKEKKASFKTDQQKEKGTEKEQSAEVKAIRERQFRQRRILVDWLFEAGEAVRLSTVTCHTASSMMDKLLTEVEMPRKQLQLAAVGCLLTAAKWVEKDERVQWGRHLRGQASQTQTKDEVAQMESRVLKACNWDVDTLTCSHFLEVLLVMGVVVSNEVILGLPKGSCAVTHLSEVMDFCENNKSSQMDDCSSITSSFSRVVRMSDKTVRYVRKQACFFADLSLQEVDFLVFDASLVASACVAAARRALNFARQWSPELVQMTAYSLNDLQPVLSLLWRFYEKGYGEEIVNSWRQVLITHLNAPSKSDNAAKITLPTDNKENEASNIYHFEAFLNKNKNKDVDNKNMNNEIIDDKNNYSKVVINVCNQQRKVLSEKNI